MITSSGRNRYPFTASQWQELEHQALIFKYMASGIPIPPDLLFPIRRSSSSSSCCTLDSSPLSNSKLFSRQSPHFGWSCFQMGLGLGMRKIDPEPGRCRRTDGKKWRCSKEAYADSKYCERHMHRGKNRSRKPVEVAAPTTHEPTTAPTTIVSSISRNSLPLMSPHQTHHQDHRIHYPVYQQHDHPNHQFFSPHSSSSRPFPAATGIGLSSQENSTHHLLLDSTASFSLTNTTDHRNRNDVYGLKEEVDEHAFFSEPSGSMRSLSAGSSLDDAWQLTMSSSSSTTDSSKQRSNLSSLHNEYSYLQLQSLRDDHDNPKQQQQQQKQFHQQSYLLGTDLSSLAPIKLEKEQQTQKTTVHRFFDEWPPKNRDSWLDLDDKSSDSASVSTTTTRLSISIPSSHEFPIFNSRN